jgi:hypothetical protein
MALVKTKQYSFTSKWIIDAPLNEVWHTIYESESWSQWWKSVISVVEIQKGDERGIGSIRVYKMRSPMLYTLCFNMLVTERIDYKLLRGEASGELCGEGVWHFHEENHKTIIECCWNVHTAIWWMNVFSYLLRPAFEYNHAAVMRNGAISLGKKLNTSIQIIS